MTRAGPHKDTWTRPGERRRHPVLSLTKHQTKDGRTPSSEASSQASFIIGLKTEFPGKLILARYDCEPSQCHQASVSALSVCSTSCANIGPRPCRVCRDPAACSWRLNLGNIKIRELMQIANSSERFSAHSEDQGVEPGWFAFQWTLTILVWYHLILICDPSKQNVTFYEYNI